VGATVHQLRHWYGTNLYRTSGRDILLVRVLMGHSSVLTTQGYLASDRAGAAEPVARLGPCSSHRRSTSRSSMGSGTDGRRRRGLLGHLGLGRERFPSGTNARSD
jgi:Phage integrase family